MSEATSRTVFARFQPGRRHGPEVRCPPSQRCNFLSNGRDRPDISALSWTIGTTRGSDTDELAHQFEFTPGDDVQVAFWPGDGSEYYRLTKRIYVLDPAEDNPLPRDHREYELMAPARHGWETERVPKDDRRSHYCQIDEIPEDARP